MHEDQLKELGLTDNEVRIYLIMLKQGTMNPSEISQKLGLHRGYVYDALERMQEKEVVSSILKDNKKYFQATSPDNLIELLKFRLDNFQNIVPDLMKIAGALAEYRDNREFFSSGIHLNPDYFVPSQKLIIEYDERQHFTIPRAIALSNYPDGLRLGFDKSTWISACETTKATDSHPKYHDEQRAFYDSLRDILAARNGITVIRIKNGDYDWSSEAGTKDMEKLLIMGIYSKNIEN